MALNLDGPGETMTKFLEVMREGFAPIPARRHVYPKGEWYEAYPPITQRTLNLDHIFGRDHFITLPDDLAEFHFEHIEGTRYRVTKNYDNDPLRRPERPTLSGSLKVDHRGRL